MTDETTTPSDAAPAPTEPAPVGRTQARARRRRGARAKATPRRTATTVLRYVGDGSTFQSGIPNRDVTTDDNLPDELADLAVATGTHERT